MFFRQDLQNGQDIAETLFLPIQNLVHPVGKTGRFGPFMVYLSVGQVKPGTGPGANEEPFNFVL